MIFYSSAVIAVVAVVSNVNAFVTQTSPQSTKNINVPSSSRFLVSSSTTQLKVATSATPSSSSALELESNASDEEQSATSFVGAIATSAGQQQQQSASAAALNDDDDLDSVEFPPPLSALDRAKRAATFWSTAIPIVANYYGLVGNLKLKELISGEQALQAEEVEVSTQCSPAQYNHRIVGSSFFDRLSFSLLWNVPFVLG